MGATPEILVVEDERDLADMVKVNLELAGYAVRVANDGAAGLEAARDDPPALVLLDVMMPVLDGWSVLRELREDPELRDLPVIMMTALSEERDIIRGHLGGAVEYVTKPFERQKLLAAVERGLAPDDQDRRDRRERVRRLLQRLAQLDSGRSAEPTVRLSGLEQRPVPRAQTTPTDTEGQQRLARLTENQRQVAEELAAGRGVREIADELDVSRSNVYATRKRIARKLGVPPDEVPEALRRLTS